MRNIYKLINIALIFTIISMVSVSAGYALRPPSHFNKATEAFVVSSQYDKNISPNLPETRYAISLLIKDSNGKLLYSFRNPDFHKVFPNVWGLGFSMHLTKDQFEVLISTGNGSEKLELSKSVLTDIVNNIAARKLDSKVNISIGDYVIHGSNFMTSTGPGVKDYNLNMVLYNATVEGELPSATAAYSRFNYLTVDEYKQIRIKYIKHGLCTDLLLINDYLGKAEEECKTGSKEVFEGFWENPEIVNFYWASLPGADELTVFLADKIAALANGKGRVLIVGGAAGRLGRYLAKKYPEINVAEADISPVMVRKANELAREAGIKNYISMEADGFDLPYEENSFDVVAAQGFLRHFYDSREIDVLTNNMLRVSKGPVFLGETTTGYRALKFLEKDYGLLTEQAQMNMTRVSLFAHLYNFYRTDKFFTKLIDGLTAHMESEKPHIVYLANLAGANKSTLYYLTLNKEYASDWLAKPVNQNSIIKAMDSLKAASIAN
jgi:ubiquinone/menaquinone biosynthesis C-methylase UbiE